MHNWCSNENAESLLNSSPGVLDFKTKICLLPKEAIRQLKRVCSKSCCSC
jgi:hypothetical protein